MIPLKNSHTLKPPSSNEPTLEIPRDPKVEKKEEGDTRAISTLLFVFSFISRTALFLVATLECPKLILFAK